MLETSSDRINPILPEGEASGFGPGETAKIIPFPLKATEPGAGLPEDQVGPDSKGSGRFAGFRRVLSRFLDRIDTNKENIPPSGKAF